MKLKQITDIPNSHALKTPRRIRYSHTVIIFQWLRSGFVRFYQIQKCLHQKDGKIPCFCVNVKTAKSLAVTHTYHGIFGISGTSYQIFEARTPARLHSIFSAEYTSIIHNLLSKQLYEFTFSVP